MTQLKEADERCTHWDDPEHQNYRWVNSFTKAEFYTEFKHARAINARVDEMKVKFGPIFKLIEEQVFRLKWFIKKIPVVDRPKYIIENLHIAGARVFISDYEAFESLFEREIMEACERELYSYMTSHLPEGGEFMEMFDGVILNTNLCRFKWFRTTVRALRMSGEMNTSLGNGFSNLMFLLFACHEFGATCEAAVEGDDGVASIVGTPPTTEFFAELGLRIKLKEVPSLAEGSFCGLIFDPGDLINVTDPMKYLASFGWIGKDYLRARGGKIRNLLRCKALSLAYQFRGCPILGALAQFGLRHTSRCTGVSKIIEQSRDTYWKSHMKEVLALVDETYLEPPIRTRLLVEERYGISVEAQRRVEQRLLNADFGPLRIPELECDFHPHWGVMFDFYTLWVPKGQRLDDPGLLRPDVRGFEEFFAAPGHVH